LRVVLQIYRLKSIEIVKMDQTDKMDQCKNLREENLIFKVDNTNKKVYLNDKKWYFKKVLIGPGGIKGFLELGALMFLEENEMLKNVNEYIGISIGSILALMIVMGYKTMDIYQDAIETDYFQDLINLKLSNLKEIKNNMGLISNIRIRDQLYFRIYSKYGYIPTLNKLYELTKCKLVCVALNLDQERTEYLSYETYPDMPCLDAVLLSINIPILFYTIKYNDNVYVDGALGDPYPVHLFEEKDIDKQQKKDKREENYLGISIESYTNMMENASDTNIIYYLYKIIHTVIVQNINRSITLSNKKCHHLKLYTEISDTTGITLSKKQKNEMVVNGYQQAEKFFSNDKEKD
jgi:hypothetical protein